MWRSLSRSLEEYCKRKNIQHALLEARVVSMWPNIILKKYADASPSTKIVKIQKNVLHIWVNEPLWVGELEKNNFFFSQQIEKETGYQVEKIVFLYRVF